MRIIVLIVTGVTLAYLIYFFLTGGKTLSPATFRQEFNEAYKEFIGSFPNEGKLKLPSFMVPNGPNDDGSVGAMNKQYLQGDSFIKLVVEVDHAQGAAPSSAATNELLSALRKYTEKPDGVNVVGANSFESTKDRYTLSDIRAVAKAHRSQNSRDGVATLHVLYLNGLFADDETALGLAVNASTIVIFPDNFSSSITTLVFPSNIEQAVLIHELGRLFGLVNVNYKSVIAHEDPAHKHHSNNEESVMYWAVEDTSVVNILRSGPSHKFDSSDEADIAGIKSGAY